MIKDEVKGLKIMPTNGKELLPVALIGLGVRLVAFNMSKSGKSNGRSFTGNGHSANGKSTGMSTGMSSGDKSMESEKGEMNGRTLEGLKNTAGKAYDKLGSSVTSARDKVLDMVGATSDRSKGIYDKNPLAVGLAAAALGTTIGFALPLTAIEERIMKPTSRGLISQIEETAHEGIDRIQNAAEEVISGASEASEKRPEPMATPLQAVSKNA